MTTLSENLSEALRASLKSRSAARVLFEFMCDVISVLRASLFEFRKKNMGCVGR